MNTGKSLLLAAAIFFAFIGSSVAQTADEIIDKHVNAVGGIDNWRKITSVILSGNVNFGGVEMPVTITTLHKKGYRMEFTLNGMINYMILTPTEGWMCFPVQGQTKPEAAPAELVKEQQDELDVTMDPLIDYKTKGNIVTYLGKDEVEGTECHKLKVVNKGGVEETVFLDASSYYCIRSTQKSKANGKEEESITNFGNYQKLPEGIVFPMSMDNDGAPVTIKSVQINKPIDEKIFKPSESKK